MYEAIYVTSYDDAVIHTVLLLFIAVSPGNLTDESSSSQPLCRYCTIFHVKHAAAERIRVHESPPRRRFHPLHA